MDGDQRVLLLNSTYEPLTILTARRAVKLIFARKANVVEHSSDYLATVRSRIKLPSVIQVVYFVKKPYARPKFSKKAVFARDNYRCQYCGVQMAKPTIDHVVPRSRKVLNDWANVVTSCSACNNKKGSRTPKEAGMQLLRQPQLPKYFISSVIVPPAKYKKWEKYLNGQAPQEQEIIRSGAELTYSANT